MLDIACKRWMRQRQKGRGGEKRRTTDFLLTITGYGTKDSILLADQTVSSTVDVILSTSSVVLGFSSSVLLPARLLPGGGPCQISNRLDDGALDGVVLAGTLAIRESAGCDKEVKVEGAHLG